MDVNLRNPTKDDVEPQYIFDVESNFLWVDTLYWTITSDLLKMEVKHSICSKYVKLYNLQGRFYLELEKLTPDKFVLQLVRELDDDQVEKSGYHFQVSFTVVASPCPRKITYMAHDINNAPVHFTLDELLYVYGVNDEWMIKCVIWMKEYSQLDNDRRKEQEVLWKKKLKESAPEYSQYKKMASIMGCESFKWLFTGRQDNKFADYKSTLLLRSFRYADTLLSNISRHQKDLENEQSVLELGRLLGYIRNGQDRCISDKDCILLYASAFYCGLSYLKLHCSDYIKMNLEDIDFFIDVLVISDMVNDRDLLDYASQWFVKNKRKVLRSVQWNNFKNRNYELARGFRFSFLRWECAFHEEVLEHVRSFIRVEDIS